MSAPARSAMDRIEACTCTTLTTFLLQTPFDVRSVELIGSWDHFSRRYPMEKDLRRGRGIWRGCHVLDDHSAPPSPSGSASADPPGGLRMGGTYWYYYILDGDLEAHNAVEPSTTVCPLIPGQPVNVLEVPVELGSDPRRGGSQSALDVRLEPVELVLPPTAVHARDPVKIDPPRRPPSVAAAPPRRRRRLSSAPASLLRWVNVSAAAAWPFRRGSTPGALRKRSRAATAPSSNHLPSRPDPPTATAGEPQLGRSLSGPDPMTIAEISHPLSADESRPPSHGPRLSSIVPDRATSGLADASSLPRMDIPIISGREMVIRSRPRPPPLKVPALPPSLVSAMKPVFLSPTQTSPPAHLSGLKYPPPPATMPPYESAISMEPEHDEAAVTSHFSMDSTPTTTGYSTPWRFTFDDFDGPLSSPNSLDDDCYSPDSAAVSPSVGKRMSVGGSNGVGNGDDDASSSNDCLMIDDHAEAKRRQCYRLLDSEHASEETIRKPSAIASSSSSTSNALASFPPVPLATTTTATTRVAATSVGATYASSRLLDELAYLGGMIATN
ncbi:MAG: hypothetical protein M1826_003145 [Phylliscum demangeonii]|nr:MAG: hypothetical protein M1826_003145 [Phylliscum demangeonii]